MQLFTGVFIFLVTFWGPGSGGRFDARAEEWIVKFKAGHAVPADLAPQLSRITRDPNLYLWKNAGLQSLELSPQMEFIEPNLAYRPLGNPVPVPLAARFGEQWGLANSGAPDALGDVGVMGADIHARDAWQIARGSKAVTVAVIDSGIDDTHPDLQPNLWEKPGAPAVHGFDAISGQENPLDESATGHGTHCAGIIGAAGRIVAGVNASVSLMGVKFFSDRAGGSTVEVLKSIDYAIQNGARVINASWGSTSESRALREAISDAGAHGILFVAAAGNDADDNDASPVYPASYRLSNVVAVAGTNNRDELHFLSSFGAESVWIAAPGVAILSTLNRGRYGIMSGTSMATPFVTGAAALLWSSEPELTPAQVKERLASSADLLPSLRGKVHSNGRLNLRRLLVR